MITRGRLYALAVLGILLFVLSTIIGAALIPNYSSIHQLISESYAVDTNYGTYLRLIGFLPSGILIFIFCIASRNYLPKSNLINLSLIGLAVGYGLGTIIVSLFPCDSGCGIDSETKMSLSQIIHNSSGALTYLIVPICFILISQVSRQWVQGKSLASKLLICNIIAIVFIGLILNGGYEYLGLFQRCIEFSFLLNLLFLATYIKSNPST